MKTLIAEALEEIAKQEKAMENQVVYYGFTHKQLSEAFAKVQNKENWKFGNSAVIEQTQMVVTIAAIEFFTGGGIVSASTVLLGEGEIQIKFLGYYHHVGA